MDFEGGPFYVNGVLRRWEGGEVPRRAGVSSFGFGGTNAHVVVEEPPPSAPKARSEHADELLMISARTPAALAKVRERLADHLERHLDLDLADVAHTLRSGRKHFAYRQALVCPDVAAVARTLRSGTAKPDRAIDSPSVGFLFPGQGSQRAGMAVGWYDRIPAFRKAVDECVGLLEPRLGRDVGRCLLSTDARVAEELQRTDLAQPALFVVEYALACALAEWGIRPEAMIGHSVGEYVAACLAGVLSLADALHLVSQRGSLMQGTAHGAMLSVDAPHEVLRRFESADVAIAAVNTTASGVLSGPDASIERVESALDAEGVSHRRLKTAHAFHSPAMDEVLDRFREVVRTVELNEPQTPYVSTLTGTWVRGEDVCDPEYWVRQLRETVNFDAGLRTLLDKPHRVLLEVGPGQSLTTLARHHDTRADQPVIATGTRPGDERGTFAGLLDAVGRLWAAGVRVDWRTVVPPGSHRRLPLPTYPFERERYWIEAAPDSPKAVRGVRQYVPGWRRSVPLELGAWPQSSERSRAWLVFADENGIAARVASRLRGRGDVVTIVVAGDGFHADSGDRHVVRPGDRGDYRRLLDHLAAVGRWPTDVLHLWSLHHQEPGGPDERLDSALTTGLHSVLALGSALVDRGDLSELSVVFAVSGTQSVTGDESIRPERATVLGPCKVIPQEIPEVSCRVVDVDLPRDEGGLDRLAARLEEEARTARPEPLVAYRGTTRWVQTFEPVDIDDVPSGLRDRGVYLITGGFGRIGLAIGRHLAATAHARLVIVGRTVVPDRAEWPAWLAGHAADDQVSVRIRSVEELERSGAEVLVLAADVTDAEAIRSVVDTAHRVFGALDGVIHAAGGTDAAVLCPIADLDVERCEEILSPRVVAPMAFAAALAEYPPADFVVLQSSLATVLGGPGLAAYAAANSFLDAWALEQNGRERPQWTSIGWDVWRTGGAGEHVLDGLRGAEIFAAVAGLRGAPQLLVSDGDIEIKARESLSRVRKKEDAPLHTRPELAQACVLPDSELEHTVARVWQELLRIEPVGVHDNFFELGGDSILATQLVVRLRSAIGRELPLQALFESPTVHSLVAALEEADRSAEQPGAPVLVALSREARRARKSDLTDVTPRRASSGRKG
ncbi:SDR family NAD(P)-dependent oxidoreductase [Lentzea sp. NPDC020367]|uniref:SDR family NAD(P)-dependent oxidoreductase n=1 Tax=Lentzea sp. NPDC020367 TaxID=3364125 RepID=UPI00379A28A8